MSLTKREEAARTRAVRAVEEYKAKRQAIQDEIRGVVKETRIQVEELFNQWGKLADKTDEALISWAHSLGYEPEDSLGARGLDPSPFISGEWDVFPEVLEDPDVLYETVNDILLGEQDPFTDEPDDWTAEGAIKVIEETEPWKKQE